MEGVDDHEERASHSGGSGGGLARPRPGRLRFGERGRDEPGRLGLFAVPGRDGHGGGRGRGPRPAGQDQPGVGAGRRRGLRLVPHARRRPHRFPRHPCPGRQAIIGLLQPAFDGVLENTRVQARIIAFRFLSPQVAIFHTEGKIVPTGADSIQTFVATKGDRGWLIAAFQNTRSETS
ncbi:SgcJ/EcaC family oxidoreductase [Actinomadura madurae]|nr:SgcJ/EcaC family oxidoreductase [Actinomadura madurae]MCQ0017417.1 SgcJ/EcaC family oxidoreductase [Actinomadura madurae]